MAGLRLNVRTGEITTINGSKTILQLVPGSNSRVLLDEFHVALKGTIGTEPPALLQLIRGRAGGSGSSAGTVNKENTGDPETAQLTARTGYTSEPTSGTVIFETEFHPQGGFDWINQLNPLILHGGVSCDFVISAAYTYSCTIQVRVQE